MEAKLFEIRDRGTFIPALAVTISSEDGFLARRGGFGKAKSIVLVHLQDGRCSFDPFHWADRTLSTSHNYIKDNWDELKSSDVIDVEFILGETAEKKESESR